MNSGRYTCKANNGALDSNKKEIMVTQTINLNVNCKCATHTLYMYWSLHCYEVIAVLVLSLSHYWVLHGGSRGGAPGSLALPPPLIFRQNWGPKGGNIFWGEYPPTLTPLPPPISYLKVWICYWTIQTMLEKRRACGLHFHGLWLVLSLVWVGYVSLRSYMD